MADKQGVILVIQGLVMGQNLREQGLEGIVAIGRGGQAEATRMTEDGSDRVKTPLPAVVSVVKEINEPRLASLKGKMKSKKAPVDRWSADDLGVDPSTVGPNSAVREAGIQPPPPRKQGEILEGEPADVATVLYEKLREEKFI